MEVLYSKNVTPLSQKLLMKSRLLGVSIDGPFQDIFFYRPRCMWQSIAPPITTFCNLYLVMKTARMLII